MICNQFLVVNWVMFDYFFITAFLEYSLISLRKAENNVINTEGYSEENRKPQRSGGSKPKE